MVTLRKNNRRLSLAIDALRHHDVVAFPTETVYGLGAVALWDDAVTKIFEAKSRPATNPLIVHVPHREMARRIGYFDRPAEALVEAFWPGPLTIVVRVREEAGISEWVTAGLPTVALRSPSHPIAMQILEDLNLPLAAPSANRSGRISATTAADVRAEFGDTVKVVIDGGPCRVGLESTIVDVSHDGSVSLLRPGGQSRESIERVIGRLQDAYPDEEAPRSPGRLSNHYAPNLPLRLDASEPRSEEAYLAFGPSNARSEIATRNLSQSGDLTEAACNLFGMMRALDRSPATRIAVSPIPQYGLGEAINDRLHRAAAPRDRT